MLGKRPGRHGKKSGKPLVTVVTVCLNCRKSIEKTIKSVLEQSYDVEYIVVDGGSTDGTLDVIRRYDKRIDYWQSEKDKGIYDAMNKGTRLANGDFINFLNAGDMFHDSDVLQAVFGSGDCPADVIFGDYKVIYPGGFSRVQKPRGLKDLWKGMTLSHQSMFARTSLMRRYRFDTRYRLAADFDFVLRCYSEGCRFLRVSRALACVAAGGVADKGMLRCIREWRSIARRRVGGLRVEAYYSLMMVTSLLIAGVRRILPGRVYQALIRRLWE